MNISDCRRPAGPPWGGDGRGDQGPTGTQDQARGSRAQLRPVGLHAAPVPTESAATIRRRRSPEPSDLSGGNWQCRIAQKPGQASL